MAGAKGKERIEWLDTLRGLAVLIVYLAHVMSRYPRTVGYSHGVGKMGVWLFMVSAGFLLYYRSSAPYRGGDAGDSTTCRRVSGDSVDGGSVSRGSLAGWIASFYIRRFFRLFPCLVFGALLTFREDALHQTKTFILTILFLRGPAHLWYVPVVAGFYLLAPFLLLLRDKIRNDRRLFIIILLAGTLLAVAFPYTRYPENSIDPLWYYPVFLMGCLAALIPVRKKAAGWDAAALVLFAGLVMLTPSVMCGVFGFKDQRFLPNKYLLIGGIWTGIILCILRGKIWERLLSGLKPLQLLSRISYPFYLVHYPVIYILKKYWELSGKVMLAAAFGISLILSLLLHFLVERPCTRLGTGLSQ